MAVVYQTGTATSPANLLAILSAFAAANGWTSTATADGGVVFSYTSGGNNIRAAVHTGPLFTPPPDVVQVEWLTRGCLGASGAADYDAQSGDAGIEHVINLGPGPFTAYHFYAGDEDGFHYLHVSVEVEAGIYRHWNLGRLVAYGAVTGGVYVDGTYLLDDVNHRNQPESGLHRYICDAGSSLGGSTNTAHLRVDYDAKVNNWQPVDYGFSAIHADKCLGSYRQLGLITPLIEVGAQQYNLRTPLYPLEYFAGRASNLRSAIGRMPNFMAVSMEMFTPGQIVPYGGENWQVFPVFARQSGAVANTVTSSGLYGYAHRR